MPSISRLHILRLLLCRHLKASAPCRHDPLLRNAAEEGYVAPKKPFTCACIYDCALQHILIRTQNTLLLSTASQTHIFNKNPHMSVNALTPRLLPIDVRIVYAVCKVWYVAVIHA
jgi:hypothetical protein